MVMAFFLTEGKIDSTSQNGNHRNGKHNLIKHPKIGIFDFEQSGFFSLWFLISEIPTF